MRVAMLFCFLLPLTLPAYDGGPGVGSFSPGFYLEPMIGISASYPGGAYADYHRSFHDVLEEGTVFQGSLNPLLFGTAGIQLRFTPSTDDYGLLRLFSLHIGLQYLQTGFTNIYEAEHNSASPDYQDVTRYRETYRHHYLAIPIGLRIGYRLFGSLGVTPAPHLNSSFVQRQDRSQSGSDAIDGGFSNTEKVKFPLDKGLMKSSNSLFSLGVGYQIPEKAAFALTAHFWGDISNELTPIDYKMTQLTFTFIKTLEF